MEVGQIVGVLARLAAALQSLADGVAHLVQLSVTHRLLLSVLQGLQPLAPLWDWGGGTYGDHSAGVALRSRSHDISTLGNTMSTTSALFGNKHYTYIRMSQCPFVHTVMQVTDKQSYCGSA